MTASATEERVQSLLCQAFAALVHGYTGVAALHDGKEAAFEETGTGIRVDVDGAQLELRYDPRTGAGEWHIGGHAGLNRQGRFELQPDGTIALDGTAMEMDHAAIDLSALLKKSWGEKR